MAPEPTPTPAPLPAATDLQFEKAEFTAVDGGQTCVSCKRQFGGPYYHAQGQVVCPSCADLIQKGQQKPPRLSLAKAALYGGGAGLLGCITYASVAIFLDIEIGFVAILVGYLVGKAIRRASGGMGGRSQQILAVAITYFSITTSYIPVYIHSVAKRSAQQPAATQQAAPEKSGGQQSAPAGGQSVLQALVFLVLIAAAAPLLSLSGGISGLITLFIIYLGLQQAWKLTGRTDLLVMGPYDPVPAQ